MLKELHQALDWQCELQTYPLRASGGDTGGDSAHQRWLALVSAQTGKTCQNWRSPALTGASLRSFNPQVVGSIPTPVIYKSIPHNDVQPSPASSPLPPCSAHTPPRSL